MITNRRFFVLGQGTWYGRRMVETEITLDSVRNEFTGSLRESNKAPEPHEPICLISYEITYILLGAGPQDRTSFWKSYRKELALNLKTDYRNYHVSVCRHQLTSLRMK